MSSIFDVWLLGEDHLRELSLEELHHFLPELVILLIHLRCPFLELQFEGKDPPDKVVRHEQGLHEAVHVARVVRVPCRSLCAKKELENGPTGRGRKDRGGAKPQRRRLPNTEREILRRKNKESARGEELQWRTREAKKGRERR